MNIESIRVAFTYAIALVVVVGGGLFLFFTNDVDSKVVVAGFIGSTLTFLFGSEVSTRTARQAAAATLAEKINGNGAH